jgi:malyl-CoA/(S)-citramalyl-CoA lyase
MEASVRLHRSELAVPGSNVRMLEKAPGLGADVVMLDLEDAVAPADKVHARANVIDALRELDWAGASVSLRIIGLETHWCYRDIVDVVERAGSALDTITVPKVGSPSDVAFVATLLGQIEEEVKLAHRIGISVLIETAAGMACVEDIAAVCPDRMEAMVFGVADYAASLQSAIGGVDPAYSVLTGTAESDRREAHWGDQWHYALARIAVACRANGLRPIDGPFGDFTDEDGYLAAARRAAILGFEGKWAIHPSQVPLANDVFTPDAQVIERTHRIIAAMKEAAADGKGAVSLDGRLIDAASIRMAENLLAKLEQIDRRTAGESATPRPRKGELERAASSDSRTNAA